MNSYTHGSKPPGVIAEELDLPRWVIEAWQRLLNRAERLWERSA